MWIMTDSVFRAKCLSQYQEILSKTRVFGTGKYSKLGRTLYYVLLQELCLLFNLKKKKCGQHRIF